MSLLRLLTTGKSLVDLKDTESRYRVTSQRLLPQFGPTRNPFSSREKAERRQPETPLRAERSLNGAPEETSQSPGSGGGQGAAPARSNGPGFGEVLRLRTVALLSGWKARWVGWLARPHNKTAKTAIPRFTKPPVQGELSLDRIRVARNDLSDADLEVVLARPPVVPALQSGEKAGGVETTWRRVRSRILGASKTYTYEGR
jgi:hypothetical protein